MTYDFSVANFQMNAMVSENTFMKNYNVVQMVTVDDLLVARLQRSWHLCFVTKRYNKGWDKWSLFLIPNDNQINTVYNANVGPVASRTSMAVVMFRALPL